MFSPRLTVQEATDALGELFIELVDLGQGGQAAVFKARLRGTAVQETVALKVYGSDHIAARSKREIAALRAVTSPHLARLLAGGSCNIRGDSCHYLATAFVDGEPISSLINSGPLSPRVAWGIGLDVARAIDALWTHRIVHRDIKPANVIVDSAGRAVLIDLGIARDESQTPITTVGTAWGTPGYMSPEQMSGRRGLTCKSDIFALGMLLQEVLAGRHPTNHQQMPLRQGGIKTRNILPSLAQDAIQMIDAMLSARPEMRPAPEQLIRLLSSLLDRSAS